jgi:ubiquinone/menaquinone biosynthesis C-methylase UbiE
MEATNYYDRIAQIYDRTRWMTEAVAIEVADFMLELIAATPDTCFLEPGIGTGLNVMPLVKRGYSVTGVDISKEMLDQFSQKLGRVPNNLNLIHGDASHLDFPDCSFDVVLTVHMMHTVTNWMAFLDEIGRVLKPKGFYLNCQWITPPARLEFECFFRSILAKYADSELRSHSKPLLPEIDVYGYWQSKGYESHYYVAKTWRVSNTVKELLGCFRSRAYGLCWQLSEAKFNEAIAEFEEFCLKHYGSLKQILSSEAKFEIWAYTAP